MFSSYNVKQEPTVQQTWRDFYIHKHTYPTCFRFPTKDVRSDRIYAYEGLSHMGDSNIEARNYFNVYSTLERFMV